MIIRFGEEMTKIIHHAAEYIEGHPYELWDNHIQIKHPKSLKNQILNMFLHQLATRKIDIFVINFVFKFFYYIVNKTI